MTRSRKTKRRWPFAPPRQVRSVITGAQGQVVYQGTDPQEAARI